MDGGYQKLEKTEDLCKKNTTLEVETNMQMSFQLVRGVQWESRKDSLIKGSFNVCLETAALYCMNVILRWRVLNFDQIIRKRK